jgi:hypothetical protein
LPLGSGCPSFAFPFDEEETLATKNYDEVDLTVDTPVAVEFGGVTEAGVIVISVANGLKVTAQITSADGVDQAVPVDDTLILFCRSVPVTAINLTRMPATATKVKVFLGEKTT